ncbi:MAG: Fe-S protein assembly co-chaperone HscB, partial [Pedobacter sp.]
QSFLMEMMEVNEALMDLEFEPDADKLSQVRGEVDVIEQQLEKELDKLVKQFDESPADAESLLPAIKDIFYRQKYISRIRERLPKN